ncbi:MAG: hypothetical protein NC489_19680 [Ruminococcus flavefaciens]|nr:hypothetical protein [Ruminococcus flavefaciens]
MKTVGMGTRKSMKSSDPALKQENKELKKSVKELTAENDSLKKAVGMLEAELEALSGVPEGGVAPVQPDTGQ